MKSIGTVIVFIATVVLAVVGYHWYHHQRIQTLASGIVVEVAVEPDTVFLPGKPAKAITGEDWLNTTAGQAFVERWRLDHPADTVILYANLIPDSIMVAEIDTTVTLTAVVNDTDTTLVKTTLHAEHSYSPFYNDFHYWGFGFGGLAFKVELPPPEAPKPKSFYWFAGVMVGMERVGVQAGLEYKRVGINIVKINNTPLMGGVLFKF